MRKNILLLAILWGAALAAAAQSRSTTLFVKAVSVPGDNLKGQAVSVKQTDWDAEYEPISLDSEGTASVKVFPGPHSISIIRDGFLPATATVDILETQAEARVELILQEQTRQPYALSADYEHNVFTGKNSVSLTWNTEKPVFFDDFESYEPWATQFGEWTGFDNDNEAAAPLLGNYPNRGVLQYAQIINPLTVEPTWWGDYPILRPYEGSQYVGFTRTNTGAANDDWLITPAVTPGTDNVFEFMGKAGDQFTERFLVYVTTVTDNPSTSDFVRIDEGNYETADHTGWRRYQYDLSDYAGVAVKLAIRYISDYNRYRSFMLMVDNVYIGQPKQEGAAAAARRAAKSPANPNESFVVYLDGTEAGRTDAYSFTLDNVEGGSHTIGVKSVYKASESDVETLEISIPEDIYADVVFNVTADSRLSADGVALSLVNAQTSATTDLTVDGGTARVPSLPKGQYVVSVAEGAFNAWQENITVDGDATFDIVLSDRTVAPFNIIARTTDDGSATLTWNQELSFNDSFETYDDFATGQFGQWLSLDEDRSPVYPISLAGSIISFPGSGTQNNPTAIAPMVFNPWTTQPAMMPRDAAVAAPTGKKTVIFFSPQRARADKWLISPEFTLGESFVCQLTAKGYEASYLETMDICISDGSVQPSAFTPVASIPQLASGEWMRYEADLSEYEGRSVRLAVHYTSYDAFFAQIDDFTVGPAEGKAKTVGYGNIVCFEIYVDGTLYATVEEPQVELKGLSSGSHTVSIVAVYKNSRSEAAVYELSVVNGVGSVAIGKTVAASVFSLQGTRLQGLGAVSRPGVYIINKGGKTEKHIGGFY